MRAKFGDRFGQSGRRIVIVLARRDRDEFGPAVDVAMRKGDANACRTKIDAQRQRPRSRPHRFHQLPLSAPAVKPIAAPPARNGPKRTASERFARPEAIMTTAYKAPSTNALPIATSAIPSP